MKKPIKVSPKKGLLAIRKHSRTALKADIAIEESDDDKNLITGEVLSSDSPEYKVGTTVIFGKYALYRLVIQGENFYLLDEADILGTCDYSEKV